MRGYVPSVGSLVRYVVRDKADFLELFWRRSCIRVKNIYLNYHSMEEDRGRCRPGKGREMEYDEELGDEQGEVFLLALFSSFSVLFLR